ncbi:MAG: hypothetical protein ABI611_00955 [Solirubrobacteraceae bacterium]
MPVFRLLAIGETILLARRHFQRLDANDRRRLRELVRRGRGMTPAERDELRRFLARLDPRAFAFATANAFSPVRLPRRFAGRSAR